MAWAQAECPELGSASTWMIAGVMATLRSYNLFPLRGKGFPMRPSAQLWNLQVLYCRTKARHFVVRGCLYNFAVKVWDAAIFCI